MAAVQARYLLLACIALLYAMQARSCFVFSAIKYIDMLGRIISKNQPEHAAKYGEIMLCFSIEIGLK